MKLPRFEEVAQRWQGKAQVFIVYSTEAHPKGRAAERLAQAADQIERMDADGDGRVTQDEYAGPPQGFVPFDVDADGIITSYELLTARRVESFADFAAPADLEQRRAAARKLRAEVPGSIPILIDDMQGSTAQAYGGMPNPAVVIGTDGRVVTWMPWANARDVDAGIAQALGAPAPDARPEAAPDWSMISTQLERAQAEDTLVLLHFTAMGCAACEAMEPILATAAVKKALRRYTHVPLAVEQDEAWSLFEALRLDATPAFVVVDPRTKIPVASSQGRLSGEQLTELLAR